MFSLPIARRARTLVGMPLQPPRRNYSADLTPSGAYSLRRPQASYDGLNAVFARLTLIAGKHLASEVRITSKEKGENVFPYRVLGMESQVVEVDLDPNQGLHCLPLSECLSHVCLSAVIRAEVGSLLFMTAGVEMETKVDGFQSGLKRCAPIARRVIRSRTAEC
jgi:hypothetical protein